MHINQLIDDCLLAIFDELPPADLLRLEAVCTKWNGLHEQTCRRMHTLVLVNKKPFSYKSQKNHSIEFEQFAPQHRYLLIKNVSNPQTMSLIANKFPTIRSFEFYEKQLHIESLLGLLSRWNINLKMLKVCILSSETTNLHSLFEQWRQLVNAIGSLVPNLEHLHLEDYNAMQTNFEDKIELTVHNFPTGLPQLKR